MMESYNPRSTRRAQERAAVKAWEDLVEEVRPMIDHGFTDAEIADAVRERILRVED